MVDRIHEKFPHTHIWEYTWDDLRFPATAINPPGQASDPDVEAASGLLLFAAAGTELVYALAQLPHTYARGTDLEPHVHWQKTTSASGDVVWQCSYKFARIGETMDSSWTDLESSTVATGTPDTDTADKHLITGFDTIDGTGTDISDCILFRISRLGDDASDSYGADCRLLEFDVHFQSDAPGSDEEFIKNYD